MCNWSVDNEKRIERERPGRQQLVSELRECMIAVGQVTDTGVYINIMRVAVVIYTYPGGGWVRCGYR